MRCPVPPVLFVLVVLAACARISLTFTPLRCTFRRRPAARAPSVHQSSSNGFPSKPHVVIEYCTGCRWLLRSAYYAQELLQTFEADLDRVALKPNSDKPGGVFTVTVTVPVPATAASAAVTVWDRKASSTPGFPETKVLKQLVRDVIAPAKDLGHSDRSPLVMEVPPEPQPE